MSAAGYGDLKYFMELSIEELREIVDEVSRIIQKRKIKRR